MTSTTTNPPTPRADDTAAGRLVSAGDEHRWLVDVDLWRDTLIPLTVLKAVTLAAAAPALLLLVVELFDGDPARGLRAAVQVYAITAGVLLALFVVAYPIFVLVKGGRHSVAFEMDATHLRHVEMPRSTDRSALLAWVGVLAGMAARDATAVSGNVLALARREMTTRFADVRKVVIEPRRHVLRLVARDMTRNVVYTHPEDFERLRDAILERCRHDVRVVRR